MNLQEFDNQLRGAIKKYGDEHVDILIDEDIVYGTYHSRNNSFPVTDTISLSSIGGIQSLIIYENEFDNLCICFVNE